jgi:integral membrane protein (TIGR00529 family)
MTDLIKIILVFLAILLLLRKKLGIGYVMFAASLMLALLYTLDLAGVAETIRKTALNSITIKLFLALSLIRTFELILREKNLLSDMMATVKGLFSSRRAIIISMPMLIGMLPSLGGAYFSAPMVKESTSGLKMSPEEKAFINYWFRHPWEFILPLYPGILLASAVSNVPLYFFIAMNFICAFLVFVTGFIYSMRGEDLKTPELLFVQPKEQSADIKQGTGWSFLPIFAVLVLVMALHVELHYALMAIIIPLLIFYRYRPGEILRVTRHGFASDVAVMIFGIMLFKEVMEASGAVKNLSLFFVGQGIPLLPILCLLPFVTGLLTGHSVGFVGSTFPLLMNISGGESSASMSMAFAAGFIGVLLSPVHLCLVLTREYFKADMWGIYRKIIPSSAIIITAALIEYFILL